MGFEEHRKAQRQQESSAVRLLLGLLVAIVLCIVVAVGYFFFVAGTSTPGEPTPPVDPGPATAVADPTPNPPTYTGGAVRVGIAYGTEKRRWLEWATTEFAKTEAGRSIDIHLIPMGSIEGAQAVLKGDRRIHVWSPASSQYFDQFVTDWTIRHETDPVVRRADLALTPMVFVFWKPRYDAFVKHYKTVSFKTIGRALHETGGWSTIADKPEWGLFKFGHTHPNQSNSGLMALALMAGNYHGTADVLTVPQVVDVDFQAWMQSFERAVGGLAHSTGTMMREMVLKGPSAYDAVFVYENLAIDYLKSARGRWGDLHVVYPEVNAWNDNPYVILNTPWSTDAHRQAAEVFLDYLLSKPLQRRALEHGFRPGNPDVPVKFPESPFVRYGNYGLKLEVNRVCKPLKAEVLTNLLASWQRSQGPR